jgi:hypothetical protein
MTTFSKPLSRTPRLVNHFALGADPEFALYTASGDYFYAEELGLDTLHAFGCDMCGRIAELRAHPSKFALDVIASLIEALRWMAMTTLLNDFKCVAAVNVENKDGCGGHIHFGRKTAKRKEEIALLDSAMQLLFDAGVLDKLGQIGRLKYSKYGRSGDFRLQTHGYEYRAIPTWMSDPWVAYLTIVVNKLMILQEGSISYKSGKAQETIKSLLTKYQGLDDDAAIALAALSYRGFPKAALHDFKPFWGMPCINKNNNNTFVDKTRHFFPATIQPEEATRQELLNYLIKGEVIPRRAPKPTWIPFELPHGYVKVTVQPHILGHLPDIATGLVAYKCFVNVGPNYRDKLSITTRLHLPITKINEAFSSYSMPQPEFILDQLDENSITIGVPERMRRNRETCKNIRNILGNTALFPVCKGKDFYAVNWRYWGQPVEPIQMKMLGKQIKEEGD